MRVIRDQLATAASAGTAHFTGSVLRTDYISPSTGDEIAGSRFIYQPGARSFWHIHEHEQAIIAVYGHGIVAWEGLDAPVELHAGDWWHVQPGVPHWHGATTAAPFAHLAVTAGGATIWLQEVDESEYRTPPSS